MRQVYKRIFRQSSKARVVALSLLLLCAAMSALSFWYMKQNSLCENAVNRDSCRQEAVSVSLASGDIPGAVRKIALFSNDSEFSKLCHSLMHSVGKAAYENLKSGASFAYSTDMEMCSFGFFHGFMDTLTGETRSPKEAGLFCTGEWAAKVKIPREECFHGIGHGVVDQHNPKEWEDVPAIISRSLSVCHSVQVTEQDFSKCAGGVYNGIANAYWWHEYGLSIDASNPFKICQTVAPSERPVDCYSYMARTLLSLPSATFKSVVDAIIVRTPVQFRESTIAGASVLFPRRPESEAEAIQVCEGLPDELSRVCLHSYAQGIIQVSGQDRGKVRALAFCAQLSDEKAGCVKVVSDELGKYSGG